MTSLIVLFVSFFLVKVVVADLPSVGRDVILPPISLSDKNTLPEVCFVFAQGADIKPDQYTSLAKEIQQQAKSHFKLWVGIPEFLGDYAEPLVIDHGIQRILSKMQKLGMTTNTLVTGGHSLGGAMIQLWTNTNADKVKAQVLMGAFLTRAWKQDYIFNYTVPTLTIGGELDGLARVTRMAEAYHTQILDPSQDSTKNRQIFPVTVIKGVSHMQFGEGDIPSTVFKRDLLPEVSYDDAHKAIANDVVLYFRSVLTGELKAQKSLNTRLDETQTLVQPILDSLYLEGYHNFRPPCLCGTDICEPQSYCTAYCPFTQQYSQNIMAGSDIAAEGVTVVNADSFHDVWETEPTVHLPSVQNSCASPKDCTLKTTTITQGVYHTGEDLEIWKKHFDVPELDSGYLPISARELRTKLTARQSIYSHAGVANPDFEELDGGHKRCAEINQYAWDWAVQRLGSESLTSVRFTKYGQPYVMGPDIPVCPAGPCWIWQELRFNTSEDRSYVEVTSEEFATAIDYPLPKTAGFHYCKVLSPARSMEWMFVDGLREKYSLQSQALGVDGMREKYSLQLQAKSA